MSYSLVIVESPTKAKTISKFLGPSYKVLSSFGHIRDLPKSSIGIDVDAGFVPSYIIPDKSKAHVRELKKVAKGATEVLLATDEDREGEAISWHIAEALKIDPLSTKRITFHEITKHAIEEALKNPRLIDMNVVDAQQTRRMLDRLVGYELSPLLWKKIRRGLSAGRVQSAALKLMVDRERERNAFKTQDYWSVEGAFSKAEESFPAKLVMIDDKKLEKMSIIEEKVAEEIATEAKTLGAVVIKTETKEQKKEPPKPLTTSALQIDGNRRLGYSAKQVMSLAQKLYETGRITYMRTDSFNLSEKFLGEAATFIRSSFGDEYSIGSRHYTTSAKGAQEAHEAIRPTDPQVTPDQLKGTLTPQEWKVYDLIWRRTMASQMANARLKRSTVELQVGSRFVFRANGNQIAFDGFMRVWQSATEKILPSIIEGDTLKTEEITADKHTTEPPARFSDATLIKSLEEYGIGRPSTYSPTISTLLTREYVLRDDSKKLAPTDIAFVVIDMLAEHFPNIVDYTFTAHMESTLDHIAEGEASSEETLRSFYGPFHTSIEQKTEELTRESVLKDRILGKDKTTGEEIKVRLGRFGPYLQLGEAPEGEKPKRVSLLKHQSPETITLEEAEQLLLLPINLGTSTEGESMVLNMGPYGPYIKSGSFNASIPEGVDMFSVTEESARGIVSEARERKKAQMEPIAVLGTDPVSKGTIMVKSGRFGPYVTDGTTNASLPKRFEPSAVTLEEASELLEKKRGKPSIPRKKKTRAKKSS